MGGGRTNNIYKKNPDLDEVFQYDSALHTLPISVHPTQPGLASPRLAQSTHAGQPKPSLQADAGLIQA